LCGNAETLFPFLPSISSAATSAFMIAGITAKIAGITAKKTDTQMKYMQQTKISS
jgi:hypothetical protein